MKTRTVLKEILSQKNNKRVSVIIGGRQVGKTTLLKELHHQLGGIFLDLDIFSNYERVSSYERFVNTLTLEGYKTDQKKFFYVFLDEFQRYSDITMVIKNIYDHHENIKIFATGSSSLEIKNKIQESLAGRKIVTHVYPLSFEEFLDFKEKSQLLKPLKALKTIKSQAYFKSIPELYSLLEEFIIYGGYPDVVLAHGEKEKAEVLRGIFDLYIKKELVNYLDKEKAQNVKILIEQIAINNGGISNYSQYGQVAGLDSKMVKHYISILKETFLLNILKPYFNNKNKEITKSPKLYFLDNGVRNYFFNNFNKLALRTDAGSLFEGFYIAELLKNNESSDHIKYYRTKFGSEVDIVLDRVSEVIPIELKFTVKINSGDTGNLGTFMQNFKIKKGYLVNIAETGITKDSITKIDCFNRYF